MKAQAIGLVALAGLGLAVPHGELESITLFPTKVINSQSGHKRVQEQHKNLHEVRDAIVTKTTTATIVVTRPAAVIWVDQNGNVVSTQYNTPLATPSSKATPIVSVPVQPTTPAVAPPPSSAPAAPPATEAAPAPQPSSSAAAAPVDNKNVQAGGFWQGGQGGQNNQGNQAQQAPSGGSGLGICYDMISNGPCKDPGTVDGDMAMLSSNGYKMVRTYDIGCDVGVLVKAAAAHGMKAIIGINSVSNVQGDVQKLIGYVTAANAWGGVNTVYIGNEVVNNGGQASEVIAAIGIAKGMLQQAGYNGNVVTVDTFNQHLANPSLCAASSYCAANAHAFFDSSSPSSNAGSWVMNTMNQISQKTGKNTVITETGWPYGGNSNGAAVASPSDQTTAIGSIKAAFASQPGNVYIFQAFDALYKAPGPMGIEQKFGIFHS